MEKVQNLVEKILSNEITAFLFVCACAVGAFVGIAGGYYLTYRLVVLLGAY